jgi:hypothetical protein
MRARVRRCQRTDGVDQGAERTAVGPVCLKITDVAVGNLAADPLRVGDGDEEEQRATVLYWERQGHEGGNRRTLTSKRVMRVLLRASERESLRVVAM